MVIIIRITKKYQKLIDENPLIYTVENPIS